jgi:L-alanine-DL-glutamate epimerase-like enolase superfamily enzyme
VYSSLYVSPEMLVQTLSRLLSSLKVFEISSIGDIVTHQFPPFVSRSGLMFNVRICLELAIYDAYLKEMNVGHNSGRITGNSPMVYLSGGSNLMSENEIQLEYQSAIGRFDGYKFRIGLSNNQEHINKIISISEVSTPSCKWMVDSIAETREKPTAIGDVKNLIMIAKDYGAYWFEEPLRVDELREYQDLCNRFPLFIAAGESLSSKLEVETFGMIKNLGWLQIDFTHNISFADFLLPSKTYLTDFDNLAIHSWGSLLSFRASYLLSIGVPQVKWIERPAIEYEIDQFFQDPIDSDIDLVPTEEFYEMVRWFKKENRYKLLLVLEK